MTPADIRKLAGDLKKLWAHSQREKTVETLLALADVVEVSIDGPLYGPLLAALAKLAEIQP